ncbi:GWxTD domain-containing protein [Taibaiella soli]|uniref:GWxTD domain-containing protein n=1 Tax=Taibaiella soli TaxID=1649169 RepID=A0A2W2B814_9BACT|nr:GWxTD domain-containing protein [Taibaiella soli]PZF72419.1 hypothetical protein DN068_13790 [Taibaiella soli]
MTRRLWIFLLCVCAAWNAKAVDAVFNYAVFYDFHTTDGKVIDAQLEMYWQINPSSLHYKKNEHGLLISHVQTDVAYKNADGKVLHEEHYTLNTTPVEPARGLSQQIMDFQKAMLPYGRTYIEVKLTEPAFPQNVFVYHDSTEIEAPQNAPLYSTIQLLDTVLHNNQESPFLKNNRQQIPISANFFDENRKVLHFYTELYQIGTTDTSQRPLIQHIYISKKPVDGNNINGLIRKDTVTNPAYLSILDSFKLSTLPTGNYYLNTVLFSSKKEILASKSTFFQLINKEPEDLSAAATAANDSATPLTYINLNKTFVGRYNLPQLKAILKMLLPVSDAAEVRTINDFLKRPDENYIRYYIYNYFSRDNQKNPEKAWDAFADRIREVNKMFGVSNKPGYETDRGYMYLKYGKPNDMVSVPNEPGALPYEIWQYYAVGHQNQPGIILFYQPPSALNDYKLLHSTINGELKNGNWRSILFSNGSSNNSRADQYLNGK